MTCSDRRLLLLTGLEPLFSREVGVSFGAFASVEVGDSAILVGERKIGVEPDRLGKVTDRFFVVALFAVRSTSIVVGKRIIWVKPDRVIVIADGLSRLSWA